LKLVNQEELQLNYNYSDFFLEDSNKEHFVLNHGNQSHNVGIGILLNKPTPKINLKKSFSICMLSLKIEKKHYIVIY